MTEKIHLRAQVPEDVGNSRLDQVAAQLFPDYSRSRIQSWIKSGELTADGARCKTRDKLAGGEWLEINAEPEADGRWQAQDIALDIVYEDEDLLVINKPAGLVVHPAAGHADGTLLNAVLHHCRGIDAVPRAGIVHRLDRDTTGLMVVAKTLAAHTDLVAQLQAREVHREYEAVTFGAMTGGGTVDAAMGRHPQHRIKMAVLAQPGVATEDLPHNAKEAITHYRLLKRFRTHSHIACLLETGRTHQIRVHMAHLHYPLVGDPLYGGRNRLPRGASAKLRECLQGFQRQALHARRLELEHPRTGEQMEWECEAPEDFKQLLATLASEDAA